jgi:hypothetical protein
MKRFVIALFAYIILCLGICVALIAAIALIDPEGDDLNLRYFFGGTAIVSFVVSWLLLKISRQK